MIAGDPVIRVAGLSVAYRQGAGWSRVVEDVSFAILKGEAFGLVGESGCGKSTVALQLLGYRHPSLRVEAGQVVFDGTDLVGLPRPQLDALRGRRIAYVPQNPTTALNPGIRVGAQVSEVLEAHGFTPPGRIAELFDLVGLPGDAAFLRRYPHQLSGGQQQRVCIAMALACDPDLVVLDEPTTGLDVTTQEQIISLLIALRARLGMSMLYVTHDLALLSQIADRVGVMYAGRMVEVAPTAALFDAARHPYTQGLIASIPRIEDAEAMPGRALRGLLQRGELPPGCPFAPRCDHALAACAGTAQALLPVDRDHAVACWRWRDIAVAEETGRRTKPALSAETVAPLLSVESLSIVYGKGQRRFQALRDASLTVGEGETLALVGESGSGKSTLARAVSGLVAPVSGEVRLAGERLAASVKSRTPEQRRLIQFIFQNPDASLNPRVRIGTTLARPVELFFPKETARPLVEDALASVRLEQRYANRYPDELSGGERQRVAIARALVARPSLLLCDEVLSALDVSVQASILQLLQRLKEERAIAMLFISHDLAVVRSVADRICVLFAGEIVETGRREQIFEAPFHPYTYSLLQAVPSLRKQRRRGPARKTPARAVSRDGCAYAGRCAWQAGPVCETSRPPWREAPQGLRIRCHLPLDELTARAAPVPEPETVLS